MSYLLLKSNANPIKDEKNNPVLKVPIFYGVFGVLLLGGAIAAIIHGFIAKKADEFIYIFFASLLFSVAGWFFILLQRNSIIVLTEKAIIKKNAIGQIKWIEWTSIEKVTYNSSSMELKIQSKDAKMKCNRHMIGFRTLIKYLQTKSGICIPNV